jgi:hypothetical protein
MGGEFHDFWSTVGPKISNFPNEKLNFLIEKLKKQIRKLSF